MTNIESNAASIKLQLRNLYLIRKSKLEIKILDFENKLEKITNTFTNMLADPQMDDDPDRLLIEIATWNSELKRAKEDMEFLEDAYQKLNSIAEKQ